jgi:hypothetical protein
VGLVGNFFFRTGDFKEREQSDFTIDDPNITKATFLDFLTYIYAGEQSVIKPENVVDLLQAADRFMMDDLKQVCT